MRALIDLENMKLINCPPFSSYYDYYVKTLADYYISKYDGIERIKMQLNDWNKEAQCYIVDILSKKIGQSINFNPNDLLELVNK